jgi:hypothetical protein
MSAANKFGRDRFGRDLSLLAVECPQELPTQKPISSKYFTTLLAWDAESEPNEVHGVVCDRLLEWGGVWFNAWGATAVEFTT